MGKAVWNIRHFIKWSIFLGNFCVYSLSKQGYFFFFLSFFFPSLFRVENFVEVSLGNFFLYSLFKQGNGIFNYEKKKKKNHTYTNLEKLIIIGKSCLIMLLFYKKIVLFFSFSKSNNLWVELIIVFSFFLFFVDLHYERDLNFKQTL